MKLVFEKPRVPNFVRTDKGTFDIKDLSEKELGEYRYLYQITLAENRLKRIKDAQDATCEKENKNGN